MDQSSFNIPLDTWVDEPVFQTVVKDENGKEVITNLDEPRTIKVRYSNKGPIKKGCKNEEHNFILEDPNERSIVCTKCGFGTYVIAGVNEIKDGKIIDRDISINT